MSTEHTILVAVTVEAETAEEAERFLHGALPKSPIVDSWWVAQDTRYDGSDNDSAVFVNPGRQADAAAILHLLGLTGEHNLIELEGDPFDRSTQIDEVFLDTSLPVPPPAVFADALKWVLSAAQAFSDGEPGSEEESDMIGDALALLGGYLAARPETRMEV